MNMYCKLRAKLGKYLSCRRRQMVLHQHVTPDNQSSEHAQLLTHEHKYEGH